ncbi:L-threonylcarbamoyladenylate synthase [Pelagicoccus sp. SDUM812003]|uniref:L-threonylcarbamoyladenylate synthase n=1 Tax=Pelagicoccus sp. SDUM812003 TaxID=3041267 RepID=UPI00280F228A|nr:L-threonylcarbamoyladenylate synthase [Pelagicoccus sp. SDUM812003]MDQ8202778.1 L-threonylcarbamoyladenylate synthase [Pelagicoccus sp. SDUM812003]
MAKILQPNEENLRELRKFLLFGGLVGVPTETVYGLAANALDPEACAKIFEVKQRPTNDPLICHVSGIDALDDICEVNPLARRLAKRFWPGPLTYVLPKKAKVPDIVTAGLGSVAVRCSAHPDFHRLVEQCDFPIAAPSANPFAYISPTTAQHVEASLGSRISFILDGGPCAFGVESTIVDLRDESLPRVLRYGALPVEDIEIELGRSIDKPEPSDDADESVQHLAPGALPKHYSPRTPLELRGGLSPQDLDALADDQAALLISKPSQAVGANVFWLSESGKLSDIAAHLYAKLRELDELGFRQIVAEEAPELGLGLAINDRLRRASFR